MEKFKSILSCSCLDDLQPSSSDEELGNTPAAQASRQEMAEILNRTAQRQANRIAAVQWVQAEVNVLNSLDGSPPPYVTPPGSTAM